MKGFIKVLQHMPVLRNQMFNTYKRRVGKVTFESVRLGGLSKNSMVCTKLNDSIHKTLYLNAFRSRIEIIN